MKIAVGNSRMDKKWKNRDISWEDLCQRVSSTIRTTETVEEYRKLKKGAQDNIKDVGGFVGGQLREGRRKNGMVLCRSMLTLDMDYGKPGVWDEIDLLHDFQCCVYSTHISTEFARRIGAKEEEAFFVGDGSGKPTGIFAATGGAQTGVTAASSTAITADELIDLFYSLKSPYRRKAVWVMNDSTVKAIRKLKDNQGQYLWQPSLTAGTPDTILNRPVYTSSYVPAIAAGAKTIAFGDFSYYWIADRQGRSFKRLNELFATTGQVGFMATQRVDGKLILSEAIKVLAQKASA